MSLFETLAEATKPELTLPKRQIKFRMWKDGRMQGVHTMYSKDSDTEKPVAPSDFAYLGSEMIMQFTGLTDKNMVEIYEGDIVKVRDGSSQAIEVMHEGEKLTAYRPNYKTWVVVFYKSAFCLHNSVSTSEHEANSKYSGTTWAGTLQKAGSDVEVLGNVFENPELIP